MFIFTKIFYIIHYLTVYFIHLCLLISDKMLHPKKRHQQMF